MEGVIIGILIAVVFLILLIVVLVCTKQGSQVAEQANRRAELSRADYGLTTPLAAPVLSAAELLQIVQQLQSAGAQWPEILAAINPKSSPPAQQALAALRRPHLFMPHVGLNVIEDGCRRVLARDAHTECQEALDEALRTAGIIVNYGN